MIQTRNVLLYRTPVFYNNFFFWSSTSCCHTLLIFLENLLVGLWESSSITYLFLQLSIIELRSMNKFLCIQSESVTRIENSAISVIEKQSNWEVSYITRNIYLVSLTNQSLLRLRKFSPGKILHRHPTYSEKSSGAHSPDYFNIMSIFIVILFCGGISICVASQFKSEKSNLNCDCYSSINVRRISVQLLPWTITKLKKIELIIKKPKPQIRNCGITLKNEDDFVLQLN